jgi:type II secretion system protein G
MVNPSKRSRAGFTLVEILVALVLIGLLVGALVPSVLNQLGRGDTNRAIEDLSAIENAVRSFRVDVRRWPGDLDDLVIQPVISPAPPADTALVGQGGYTAGLLQQWNGPYLERVTLTPTDETLASPNGGTIRSNFTTVTAAGQPSYLAVEVVDLALDQIEEIDQVVDNGDGQSSGRIRWTLSGSDYTMQYLAVALN